jgi:rhodanese-related sulfurtransferase
MDFVQSNWMLIAAMIVSGTMLVYPTLRDVASRVPQVNTLGLTQLINAGQVVIIDVREQKELASGRLPKALHVPRAELAARAVAELAKHKARPVVVYCGDGRTSRAAAATLRKAGFSQVFSLAGGVRAWKEAGLPVEA